MNRRKWLLGGGILALAFILQCVAVREIYASRFLGGNDFYPRWAGARALFLEGRDPYDPAVTEEISAVLDPNDRQTNSFNFAYPLHVLFVMGPLAYLSYDWAYAVWMVTVQWAAFLTVAVLVRHHDWHPGPLAAAGLLFASVTFYPVSRSVILGQFTVHVTLFIALSLLALKLERDRWAGAFLAATSMKPQMVLFLAPWLLLWAFRQRRWRFFQGFLAAGVALLLGSMALFPRWPLSFIEDIPRYSETAGGRSPLHILGGALLPSALAIIQYGMAAALLILMFLAWRRAWIAGKDYFEQAINWTIVAGILVPFQTGSTSQVLLIVPLFGWLVLVKRRWGAAPAVILSGSVLTAIWLLFMRTFDGESPVMFLALPLFALVILLTREARCKRWSLLRTGRSLVQGQ